MDAPSSPNSTAGARDDPRPSTSYREALRALDGAATPAPWVAQGEFYGVVRDGRFRALGFAPHHPLDPALIVAYRNSLVRLLDVVDSVERCLHSSGGSDLPNVSAIGEILETVDDQQIDGEPLVAYLIRLDKATTQPLWDPGHLAIGMSILESLSSVDRLEPADADPHLIAAARSAVPRAITLLETIASAVVAFGRDDGVLEPRAAEVLLTTIASFDGHRADEGAGTGTV